MAINRLFVTIDDLKARMAIAPDLEGVDDNLESAIVASQLRIESLLDSRLNRKEHQTIFFLDGDSYSGIQMSGVFRLYLASGHLVPSITPIMEVAGEWNGAYTPVPATDFFIDYVRGVAYIDKKYGERYIRVSYTTGYLKASELPDWLRESIIGYAPVVLNFSQVTNRNKDAEAGYKTSGDHALAIAAPFTRNMGYLIRPVF